MLQGIKRYSLSKFSLPPTPPQHICMKKINLYKQNVTMDKASSIRALKCFIGPSVKGPELLAATA